MPRPFLSQHIGPFASTVAPWMFTPDVAVRPGAVRYRAVAEPVVPPALSVTLVLKPVKFSTISRRLKLSCYPLLPRHAGKEPLDKALYSRSAFLRAERAIIAP